MLAAAGTAAVGLAGCGRDEHSPATDSATGSATGSAAPGRWQRRRYGSQPSQFVELNRAPGAAATVVLLHGGYWQLPYDLRLMRPIGDELVRLGFTVANLEYRRVGEADFTGTLGDVATAIEALAEHDLPARTVLLGHSAGGHLAVWAASRTARTPGGAPRRTISGVVSLAGVLDLTGADAAGLGQGAVDAFLQPATAQRLALADPNLLTPSCPVLAVLADDDLVVPASQAESYRRRHPRRTELARTSGDHSTLIDPTHPAWREVTLPGIRKLADPANARG